MSGGSGGIMKRWFLIAALLLCGCAGEERSFNVEATQGSASERYTEEASTQAQVSYGSQIYVYVCGEVVSPGVYTVAPGTRVYEVLEMAGGVTENAAVGAVNLVNILEDGQKLYFPSNEEYEAGWSEETEGTALININTASKEELMKLAGIGEAKALAIIAYRQKNGAFTCTEDIMKVSGIKEAAYSLIKDRITVN